MCHLEFLTFHRKASVRLGSFRFVETANRVGSVHVMAGSFRFARHSGSVRFGSWKPQTVPVRFMSWPVRVGSRDIAVRFVSVRGLWCCRTRGL